MVEIEPLLPLRDFFLLFKMVLSSTDKRVIWFFRLVFKLRKDMFFISLLLSSLLDSEEKLVVGILL